MQYNYTYDSTNRLVSSTCTDTTNNSRVATFEYDFDLNNNHTKFAALTKYGKSVTNYTYGKDNLPDTVTFNNGVKLTYAYDTLGRNNNITVNTKNPISTNYTYWALESGGSTYRSNLIHTEKNANFKYRYTYDARNNLTKIEQGAVADDSNLTYTTLEEYTYDELSQLTQVDYRTSNKRVKYTYDDGGNIELEQIYTVSGDTETLTKTNTYTYGDDNWGDKLTAYNSNNITYNITYDAIGNPKKYRNGFTFTWSNGKQLDTLTRGTTTADYNYDDSGLRISKTANGVEYTYLYQDGLLVQETRGEMILDYSYDESGRIRMGAYRKNASATPGYFYYALNSRGDVIGIYESDGDLYAEYTYDAWGNITSITNSSGDSIANYENMATRQPFRYRGYYYDTESGFYYVSSRYYDPVTHRFINADDISLVTASPNTLTDKNLYAYCDNNPVGRKDSSGKVWETAFDVVSLGASIVEVAINPTDPWAWAGVVGDALDLIPFVTGVGEATRGVRTLVKAVDKADDVIDVAKSTRKAVKPSVGVYEITYKSGMNYVGKGNFNRAITSAKRYTNLKCDTVTSIKWKASKNSRSAFIEEFALQTKRGVNNKYTYNKIWSPGKRYYISSGGKLRRR